MIIFAEEAFVDLGKKRKNLSFLK